MATRVASTAGMVGPAQHGDLATMIPQQALVPRPASRRPAPPLGQEQLFDTSMAPIPTASSAQAQDWIDILLQSQVYVSQRSLAARVAPPNDQMRLLTALDERGGKTVARGARPEARHTGNPIEWNVERRETDIECRSSHCVVRG